MKRSFKLNKTEKGLRIEYLENNIYFLINQRVKIPRVAVATVTDAVKNLANLYLAFSIEHFPDLIPYSTRPDLPVKQLVTDWDSVMRSLGNWLAWIKREYGPFALPGELADDLENKANIDILSHLHPTVQQAASSRFTSAHYSDAIQKACTALEKAVQVKASLSTTTTGVSVMTTAFSKNSPLIHMADDPNEQFGFMALYQGAIMALRNHFAHNLTELTDPARALEWLAFLSALFYKLDEAQPITTPNAH
ncbi:TIGR02391 family protein [Hymenobacter cheonanensis]|uniref:TIGR02391 family protein n=1 Tax=Hymenobacter sp. CA2-7 TaxID=3063993 RepID=UPI002712C3C4|nr:TIGR02391 family protein [Hymenobacter sp. CA2-7]MDO7884294.1 TIGR02391 family protein [Hymenobacter sp. CA2-7]